MRFSWTQEGSNALIRPCRTLAAALFLTTFALAPHSLRADALDPLAFPSLGPLQLTAGTYTFNTATGTISGLPGHATTYNNGVTSIAVFDFDSISIGPGVTINVSGGDIALLSRSNANFAATSVLNAGSSSLFPAGAGESSNYFFDPAGSGGGGGFGGKGGDSSYAGGSTHGDLAAALEGGGRGGNGNVLGRGGGGNAGGAFEIGAIGPLTFSGSLYADGKDGGSALSSPSNAVGSGGGGSGGGIFLHGKNVTLAGTLSVRGGKGGGGDSRAYGGGGGGGGRILVESMPNGFDNSGSILLDGGLAGFGLPAQNGDVGTFDYLPVASDVPEPSGVLITGLSVFACGLLRRRRFPAVFLYAHR